MLNPGLNNPEATEDVIQLLVDGLPNYKISDIEDGTTSYYGFTDKNGNWYILKLTSTAGRYCKGSSSYLTNWTNKAILSYDYFYNIF